MSELANNKGIIMAKASEAQFYEELEKKLIKANTQYHNKGKSPFSDKEYDTYLQDLLSYKPNSVLATKVGAKPLTGNKVELPRKMGSLNKIRPDDIIKWAEWDTYYLIMPKLDGIGALLHYIDGMFVGLYTRGDGHIGQNISNKAAYIQGIPPLKRQAFHIQHHTFIRGELIIPDSLFKNKYKGKEFDGKIYKNPRNFCGGIINRKELTKATKEALRDMAFISYSFESTAMNARQPMKPGDQISMLQSLSGFIFITQPYLPLRRNKFKHWQPKVTSFYKKDELSSQVLLDTIIHNKNNIDIRQDGLVIILDDCKLHKKLGVEANELNPKYARAVKLDVSEQDSLIGEVKTVEWHYTKRRLYKPVVKLQSKLDFNGVEVSSVTAINLKYVKTSKIGPGAKLKLIRSGDVIPRIIKVIKPSKILNIPTECQYCNVELKTTAGVDLYCPNQECSGINYKQLHTFFSTLEVDGLSTGIIDQLYATKFNSVIKILTVEVKQLLKIEGFATKRATTLVTNIKQSLSNISLSLLMKASGYFTSETNSLGETRLTAIINKLGQTRILSGAITYTNSTEAELKSISGISSVSINLFLAALPAFLEFYKSIKAHVTLKEVKVIKGKLSNKIFVFTNFRDKKLEKFITTNDGLVSDTLSKANAENTILFYNENKGVKMKKALEYKIKTYHSSKAFS